MSSEEVNSPLSAKSVAEDDKASPDRTDCMKPRITYTRDFLLTLRELDACKKPPAGFDPSILSELYETSSSVLDRHRSHYASPLTRSSDGSGSYSRGGGAGRWDTRSSGSSDREGDLPERESFAPDKRSGNTYKRNWQQPEHDGLLGSGAFPRPAGYTGLLASRARGGHQLNRTSEPYQPPRPYRAAPYSRNHIDSCNDETFGSSEDSREDRDRAEEERKRRESFELMRKEHQKGLLDKHKAVPDNGKEKLSDDTATVLQSSVEKVVVASNHAKSDESVVSSVSQEDASRNSLAAPVPASRPAVPPGFLNAVAPPGFSNAVAEKKFNQQYSTASVESEPRNTAFQDSFTTGGIIRNQVEVTKFSAAENKKPSTSIFSEIPGEASSSVGNATGGPEVNGHWKDNTLDCYSIEHKIGSKVANSVGHDDSVSILDKFFGNVLARNTDVSAPHVENQPPKSDEDPVTHDISVSSRFASFFAEEEDLSSKDLLSLIVKNDNVAHENPVPVASVRNVTTVGSFPARSHMTVDAPSTVLPFPVTESAVGMSEQYPHENSSAAVPAIMTCEDLEQCMLAGVKDSSTNHAAQENWQFLDKPLTEQKANIDNNASQHLLSLLQKGTNSSTILSPGLLTRSVDGSPVPEPNGIVKNDEASSFNNAETISSSGKSVTLEALFGAAFMNELHSMEAPVSVRGPSAGVSTQEYDVPSNQGLQVAEAGQSLQFSNSGEHVSDEPMLRMNQIEKGTVLHVLSWTGMELRDLPFEAPSAGTDGFGPTGSEIQLPEEDNLFTVADTLDVWNPDRAQYPKSGRVGGLLPDRAVEQVNSKFQHLFPRRVDAENIQGFGRDSVPGRSRVPHDQLNSDSLYHSHHVPQRLPHLMNSGRPAFPNPGHAAHRNQQPQFNVPEATHHRPIHPFPGNANSMQRGPNFDPAAHHAMLQQMHVPGNFSSQFPPQLLPRGVPPSQPMHHHLPGYRPEMNNVNNLHMHPRQPNYDFGMAMPGPPTSDLGGGHPPEAFERLMQMERRARTKQLHPGMAGQLPGIYGPELDMNFRLR